MAWHARLSASQTKDWAQCPAPVVIREFFPYDDPSGKAAQLGTCAHYLIEICLGEGVSPKAYEGRLIEIIHPDTDKEDTKIHKKHARWPKGAGRVIFEVDEDMIEATTTFIDYVIQRLVDLFPDQYPAEAQGVGPGSSVWYSYSRGAAEAGYLKLESRVNPLPHRSDTGGTADVTIDAWPEMLEVIDYKNGSGVFVPVSENWQLRSYTLGRAVEHVEPSDKPAELKARVEDAVREYEGYRYTIGQPRHHSAPPSGVSWEDTTADALLAFGEVLDAAATRVDKTRDCARQLIDAGRDPAGNSHHRPTEQEMLEHLYQSGFVSVGEDGGACKWCRHKNTCPAPRAKAMEVAAVDFDDEPEVIAEDSDDTDKIAQVLAWGPFIKAYLKGMEDEAEKRLLDGQEVPGWKIVRKSANRTIKPEYENPDKLADEVAEDFGVDRSKLFNDPKPASLKTGPQIEGMVPKKDKARFAEKYLYRPQGGLALVPESDNRPAVGPQNAADDFDDDLEDEDNDQGQ